MDSSASLDLFSMLTSLKCSYSMRFLDSSYRVSLCLFRKFSRFMSLETKEFVRSRLSL